MEEALKEEIIGLLQALDKARARDEWRGVEALSQAVVNLTTALHMTYGPPSIAS